MSSLSNQNNRISHSPHFIDEESEPTEHEKQDCNPESIDSKFHPPANLLPCQGPMVLQSKFKVNS